MIKSLTIDGGSGVGKFNFTIYIPDNHTASSAPLPGFLYIPGLGQFGSDPNNLYPNGPLGFIRNGWNPPYIVAGAQPPQPWPPANTDQSFMRAALKAFLDGGYGVDKSKFYLTGLSDGAAIINAYVQFESDALFRAPAAVIPMSMNIFGLAGDYKAGTSALAGNDFRFKNIPYIGYCGKNDTGGFKESMQLYVSLLSDAGINNASLTLYDGAHNNWSTVYDPNGQYKPFDKALSITNAIPVSTPVTNPPPPPALAKTIKSILITYSDGTSESKP